MAQPIAPVTIQGRYFWKSNERFILNGVVYHHHNSHMPLSCVDMLVDDRIEELERAIPLLKDLNINTLFVNHISETRSHAACMNLLAENGIHVIVSIESICHSSETNTHMQSYTPNTMYRYFQAIDKLASYPNLLGFVVSNDLIKDSRSAILGPIIRAVVRDIRRYIALLAAKKRQRVVPVGVLAMDIRSIEQQFDYFCSGDDSETIDFFLFNNLTWGPESTMQTSGYSKLVESFSQVHVPVSFMYGRRRAQPWQFNETRALYSDPGMLRVFSGGIVFDFLNNIRHGLVRRSTRPEDGSVRYKKQTDFRNLRESLNQSFSRIPPSLLVRTRVCVAGAMSGIKPDPPISTRNGLIIGPAPPSPVDWTEVGTQIIDDSDWVDAGKEWLDISVEDLAISMWDRLNIDGINP
ncbi:glycoside hydrolase family 72 protein [Daldinia sp. FL1419]|nr:glycoside hydrolase family 72 protein [Daldinia sp. FL1419]